jgi:hypothetical protein
MRKPLTISAMALGAVLVACGASLAGDDWSFIAGTYAIDPDDCKLAGSAAPFSQELVDGLTQEIMSREGITSPREVHCKFRSAEKSDAGWKVKADCEEMGESGAAELAVTTAPDGSVSVLNEDVYGPDPLKFTLCKK